MNPAGAPMAVAPVSLDGRFARLRPITQADYGFLWECRCHPEIMYLWMQGRTLPTFEQYVNELESAMRGTILQMMMIETRDDPHPVGFIFAYDYNRWDRHTFFTIAIHPAYTGFGWGAEATLLFLNHLFAYMDLRKIYMEIYEFNNSSLAPLLRAGAHEEGRFRAHRYYQGAYHDVIRLAATREEWSETGAKLAMLLAPRKAEASPESNGQQQQNGVAAERIPSADDAPIQTLAVMLDSTVPVNVDADMAEPSDN
ncbi:MAG TPA: GNAT family protein [Ktedonobacterales bacterium]